MSKVKYISIKYIAILIIALASSRVAAQESTWNVDPGLTARGGGINFNPFDMGVEVVKAAGMELLDEGESAELIDDLLEYAHEFTGLKYRRGGKTPAGFDCSGFTHYVFSQFGYNLNSDSRSQYLQGEPVDDIRNVQPGDLVFFGGRSAGTSIGHVGIATEVDYVTGVVTFIHSATSSGIRTDTTSDPYYSRRYKGARRVIGVMEETK